MSPSGPKFALVLLVASLCLAGLAAGLAPAALAQTTAKVTISGYSFNPSRIVVVIGVNNTVTWTNNQNGVPHTVTADNGTWGMATSQVLNNGQSFTHTFTSPGTYPYHCSIHTYMKGTVVVLAGPTTTSSQSSATTSASTSSPTGTSSTSGGIPEFPYGAAAVVAVTALVVASYLVARRTVGFGRPSARVGHQG